MFLLSYPKSLFPSKKLYICISYQQVKKINDYTQ